MPNVFPVILERMSMKAKCCSYEKILKQTHEVLITKHKLKRC